MLFVSDADRSAPPSPGRGGSGAGERIFRRGRRHGAGPPAGRLVRPGPAEGFCHFGGRHPAPVHPVRRGLPVPGRRGARPRPALSGRRAGGRTSGGQGLPPAEHDLAAAGLRPAHPLRRGQGPCSFHDGLAAPPAGRDGHRGPLRLWRGGRYPAADLYDRLRRAAPGPGPGHQSALFPPRRRRRPSRPRQKRLSGAAGAPPRHRRRPCLRRPGAWAATGLDGTVLRRCFGAFLLAVGLRELFRRDP